MKIAVCSNNTGSLLHFRMDMMHEFVRRGHDVLAIGEESEGEWAPRFSENGIHYRAYRVDRNGTNPLRDLATVASLGKILKEERPDKLFAYNAKAVVYGGVVARAFPAMGFYPMVCGLGSVFIGGGAKKALVRKVLNAGYRTAFSRADRVFFQNGDDKSYFFQRGALGCEKPVLVPGSGVNTEKFAACPIPRSLGARFLLVGRLIRDKGVVEYLEAARLVRGEMPSAEFHLVGPFDSNPSALRFEDIAPYVEDGSVVYHGPQDDVRPFLREASVFVLPSYREGTPKSALEAMATGRAVITCDAPGCREVVEDGVNGILVKPGDVASLVGAIRVLATDPDLVCRMGVESRKIAENRFDVRRVNEVICEAMGL